MEPYWSECKRIGKGAFKGTALEAFAAPRGLREMGARAFADCKGLREVKLGKDFVTLGRDAFRGSQVREVEVETGFHADLGQFSDQSITTVLDLQSRGWYIDSSYRANAEKIIISSDTESIADGVFQGLRGLREVVFGENSHLEKIGAEAFARTGIEKFVTPASLRTISQAAFCGCEKLRSAEYDFWVIGDAKRARKVHEAVREGFDAATFLR